MASRQKLGIILENKESQKLKLFYQKSTLHWKLYNPYYPFDDVHLLAHVAFSTDVITRREHLKLQFEHQINQQTFLAVLKDSHFLQSVWK